MVKRYFTVAIVLLLAIVSIQALLHPGFLPTHDGEYHLIRFYEFHKSLLGGVIYPRWAADLNNGYGVPLFNFVYPFPNYFSSALHFLGFSFVDGFKFSMVVATVVSGIFSYLWAKDHWGKWGGVVTSALYLFAPYRFVDIYIRGSVGEVWALAFFPACLWSITKLINQRRRIHIFFSTIFLSLIIFSHNILGLMFFVFVLTYCIFYIFKEKSKRWLAIALLEVVSLSVSITTIFWLPALLETKFVKGLQIYQIKENFPELFQLLIPSWGSGFSGSSLQDQMSFQVGVVNLLAIPVSLLVLVVLFKRKNNHTSTVLFCLIWFAFLFVLMLRISLPIWENFPLLVYFQFPWRLLSLVILLLSFTAGNVVTLPKGKLIGVIFILLAVLFGVGYAKPAHYFDRDDNYYLSRSNFVDGTNSPGNFFNTIWLNEIPVKQKNKFEIKGRGKIDSQVISSTRYEVSTTFEDFGQLVIHTAYFPGWEAKIDQKESPLIEKAGGMVLLVPAGRHIIHIQFADTMIRRFSSLVSIAGILILFILSWKRKEYRMK